MKVSQRHWTDEAGWDAGPDPDAARASLVLGFGATAILRDGHLLTAVSRDYPSALFIGCSTAGEICGTRVADESLVVTSIAFDSTKVQGAEVSLDLVANSTEAGLALGSRLPAFLDEPGGPWPLTHVLVISDGLRVNGTELVRGLTDSLPPAVTITGGLAADGASFGETFVWTGQSPRRGIVAAIGLYGTRLHVGCGSRGGWDPFGPERLITKSRGNVLFEFDGQSALGLYKRYLGEHASGLPATGLLFPLSLRTGDEEPVVRTILSVNENERSMTFAGEIPEGGFARLMKANFDRLIDGAVSAARTGFQALGPVQPDLALLISCVGRKLVLKQRVEEEVEGVQEVLGTQAFLAGFYSYGEISPFVPGAKCELHNQTMTITTFSEV